MRRTECRRLGVAGSRWVAGQGGSWGDCIRPNPTDRGKNATKKSVLVDERGGPLGAVIDGANDHDSKLLKATIEAVAVERPESVQRLGVDRGLR